MLNIFEKSSLKAISLIVLGIAIKLAGILVTPKGIPIRVAETIPRSISHFTLLAASIAVTKIPKSAVIAAGLLKSPIETEPLTAFISPPFLNPSSIRKIPTAAPIPSFKLLGRNFTITSLKPNIDIIKKIIPDTMFIARPCCHVTAPLPTNVIARKALLPIAGARAKGSLAYNPISSVKTQDVIAVTVNTSLAGIPALFIIMG